MIASSDPKMKSSTRNRAEALVAESLTALAGFFAVPATPRNAERSSALTRPYALNARRPLQ